MGRRVNIECGLVMFFRKIFKRRRTNDAKRVKYHMKGRYYDDTELYSNPQAIKLEKQTSDFTNISQFKDESEEFQFSKSTTCCSPNDNISCKYYVTIPSNINDINPTVGNKYPSYMLPGNTHGNIIERT